VTPTIKDDAYWAETRCRELTCPLPRHIGMELAGLLSLPLIAAIITVAGCLTPSRRRKQLRSR
jgi:hypothetical protein